MSFRQPILDKVRGSIDESVKRFFEVSQMIKPLPYEAQSHSDKDKILPVIEQQAAKRWSLDETSIFLKELTNLIKETSNPSLIINEVNYLTYLCMIQQKISQKQLEQIEASKKENLKTLEESFNTHLTE